MKKISYIEIMKKTFSLYKENIIDFIKMSAILSLINVAIMVLTSILFDFSSSIITIVLGVINLIAVIWLLFTYVKVYCASINFTYNKVTANEVTLKDSFWYAKRLTPKFIYAAIMLVAMVFVPVLAAVLSYSMISSQLVRWSLSILFMLIALVVLVRYFFILFIRVIEPDSKNYITKCVTYLNGNYIQYFFILVTVNLFVIAYNVATYYFVSDSISLLNRILLSSAFNAVNIFVLPVVIIANVLVYRKVTHIEK